MRRFDGVPWRTAGRAPSRRAPAHRRSPRRGPRGVLVAAARSDQVHRDVLAGERPQPRLLPVDPPAGLIRRDRRARTNPLDQRLIGRLQRPGLTRDGLHDSAGSHPDTERWPAPWRSSAARAPAPCSARSPARPRAGRACSRPLPARPRSETGDGPDADDRNRHICRYAPRTADGPAAARAAPPDTETRCAPARSPRHNHTAAQAARRAPHRPPPTARDDDAGRAAPPTGGPAGPEPTSPPARERRRLTLASPPCLLKRPSSFPTRPATARSRP